MSTKLRILPVVLAACLSFAPVSHASADGLAGAYLAARAAGIDSDFKEASRYFALALVRDPSNTELMQSAILAYVGHGDIERAAVVARRLNALDPTDQIANMLLLADSVAVEDYDTAFSQLEGDDKIGPLVDGLTIAWIEVGLGNMSEALGTFEAVAAGTGLESFGLFHKALALALVGDLEQADKILSGESGASIPPTRRGIIAHAEILSQLERNEDAIVLIDAVFGNELDPGLRAMYDRLAAGDTLPLSAVRSAKDGVAEVFFSVAGALAGEANDGYTLLYTRIAEYLRPDHVDSILLTAQLLEKLGQHELATAAYDRIPLEDPAYHLAEIGRADALRDAGNTDAAIEALQQLSKSHADLAVVHIELGDALRALERYGEASKAYDKAIALYATPEPQHWVVYFTRGITHERTKNWTQAEADFRKALELSPKQPQVLNYLGYSFVEKMENLDEALDMIELAVKERPNDGYITDSLAWVYYRLGRYEEAVVVMEKAVELMAVDPVLNDHLGDIYWAVGREREAEFQWNRAMSFEPEEVDAIRIRRKLEVGLDVVLEEEGAKPIAVAHDG